MERPVDDLVRRVFNSLTIAQRVVHTLLESVPVIDLAALEAPQDKVLAETALLLRGLAGVPREIAPELHDAVHQTAASLRPHASSLRVRAGIALHPSLARDYALAHRCLSALGYPDPALDILLDKAIRSGNAHGRERAPHRQLEQHWIDQIGDDRMPGLQTDQTALGQGIDVLTGSRDDVYALTHAVLYATDLGSRQVALPRVASEVFCEAESALAGTLDDDDFDLAGEVLMLWPMLRAPLFTASTFGANVLFAIEDEVGLLPSLAIDRRSLSVQSERERSESALAMSYHTAYVMGLLCASFLKRYSAPKASDVTAVRLPRLLDAASSALEKLPAAPQWEAHFAQLRIEDRETLAPFVLDVAIRRAVRRFELGVVRKLALAAVEADVWTCAVRQAVGLLDRVRHLEPVPDHQALSINAEPPGGGGRI